MNYRLGLTLLAPENPDRPAGNRAVGWAVAQLKHSLQPGGHTTTGHDEVPHALLDGEGEVRVVTYQRAEDMLDPMTPEAFDRRLAKTLATLPRNIKVVRAPFDADAYRMWLAQRPDSHAARAEWANTLDL